MDNEIEEIEVTERKSVWNKTQEELTVGDAVKVNGVALATFGTVATCVALAPYAYEATRLKISSWRYQRQINKVLKMEETEEDVKEDA